MLTAKQEKFCQCIVSGMTAKDSYMTAYDTKGNEKTVNREAQKLLLNEKIVKRLDELRKPLESHAQMTALTEREKIKSILWTELEKAISREDGQMIAKYCDIINRMNAEYVQVNRNIDEKPSAITGLDTATLKELTGTA